MDLGELGFGHVRRRVADGENMGGRCVTSMVVQESMAVVVALCFLGRGTIFNHQESWFDRK